jgi:bifunctional DNA-binding transcriptional regulator/antitoxin component of YhaV-PrlF toxin-antitoxin module
LGKFILKISGIRRKLDKLGRIVLPSEYRKELGFMKQESLEIFLGVEGILIR